MTGGLAALLGLKTEGMLLFIALTLARPVALIFGFVLFPWGMGHSFILRAGIGFAVGLPVTIIARAEISDLAANAPAMTLALILTKEFALGLGMGIIASLPLLALQYAGAITDAYRGDSGSGHPDPTGGQITAWSNFFLLIGMLIFVAADGFNQLVEVLYQSYSAWPLSQMLPAPGIAAVGALMDLLRFTLRSAIVVAGPLLFVLMAVDFCLAIASRMVQRFQIMSLEFSMKNLIAALMLPLMVAYLLKYLQSAPVNFDQVLGTLRVILR